MLASMAEFVRHGRSAPVDVSALLAALPGLFEEIAASAAATNPTDPDLQAFSAGDVTKQMSERHASEDFVTKVQDRRREAENR